MSAVFRVRPQAEAELLEAFRWYEERRPGLGATFLEQVERMFHRVHTRPTESPQIYKGVRKSLVPRFPYAVLYTPDEYRIDVVAVFHTARESSKWRRRID